MHAFYESYKTTTIVALAYDFHVKKPAVHHNL